jgi:transposase-like protein
MKDSTRNAKKTAKEIENMVSRQPGLLNLLALQTHGKAALDELHMEMGVLLVESILQIERQNRTGQDHRPLSQGLYKWGYQQGSVYIGDQKHKIRKPRSIENGVEMVSPVYEKLKGSDGFSEEILAKLMAGLSARQYEKTVLDAAEAFGVSSSSVSRHFVAASAKKLAELTQRDLSDFKLFAMLIDTVHRGGVAFIVALGMDIGGNKKVLGYWEGATENATITSELLSDLERRNLRLTDQVIYIIDGGKGIDKALKDRFGDRLMVQRCTIHKDRNIQSHLAKKYRQEAHRQYQRALSHETYEDAKAELLKLEKWLRAINPSAANSLLEAFEEILTLHRLKVPEELRSALKTTNGIENIFSTTRHREKNLKNYSPLYKGKAVKKNTSQRWLATVLLNAESGFRRVKGYSEIATVIENIKQWHQETFDRKNKMAA